MLGGSGGSGLCGMAMGPVVGMLALCVLSWSPLLALPLPLLLLDRLPSVQPWDIKGLIWGGLKSSEPAQFIAVRWQISAKYEAAVALQSSLGATLVAGSRLWDLSTLGKLI